MREERGVKRFWVPGRLLSLAFAALFVTCLPAFNPGAAAATLALDAAERERLGGTFLELEDGWVHYTVHGDDSESTVVLVHGFSTPSFVWRGVLPYLVDAGLRVVTYDNYGRGFSDRPEPPYDADLFDRQLAGVVEKLVGEDTRVSLVGYSMGGAIVGGYVARRPGRVKSLAMIAPAGYGASIPMRARVVKLPLIGHWLFEAFASRAMMSRKEEQFRGAPADFMEKWKEQLRYPGYFRALGYTLSDFPLWGMGDSYKELGRSGVPVMAVWGDADMIVPYATSKDLARDVPGLSLKTIANGGHSITYSQPGWVGPLLAKFLVETGG
jgi:pimeloyl-ACP methyl ester carboxylesterase